MTGRWLSCLLAALLIGFTAPAFAIDPIDSMPDYRPSLDTDEGGLWMLIENAEKDTQQSPLLVADPALNAYLRKIVCDLAGPHCSSIRPYILDIPVFNAAMYPNGMMHVFTGLLMRTENEAQLAFVLGHEIGHFLERHSLEQFRNVKNTSDFLAFMSLVAGGAGVGIAADIMSLAAIGILYSYSRANEREADERGLASIVARGYDPRQGAVLWKAIIEEEEANPRRKKRSAFTATHPSPADRMTTLAERAAEIQAQSRAGTIRAESYRATMAPFRGKWLEAELNRGVYEESLVVLNRLVTAEPASGELQFYLGEIFRRRGKADELEQARSAYNRAIAGLFRSGDVYRSLGLVAMKLGDKPAARQAFQQYLAVSPDADDRQMVQYYLSQL